MKNGEKLIALENVIYQTAKSQFAVNRVSAVEARMVMKAVCERFSELCLETFVLERVSMRPQENQEQQNAEVHTLAQPQPAIDILPDHIDIVVA